MQLCINNQMKFAPDKYFLFLKHRIKAFLQILNSVNVNSLTLDSRNVSLWRVFDFMIKILEHVNIIL